MKTDNYLGIESSIKAYFKVYSFLKGVNLDDLI